MDRVAAVKSRLGEVMSVARDAMAVGPSCLDCRYKRFGTCRNPTFAEPSFDPALGTYTEAFTTSLAKARADDGLCGPEALLFEPSNSLMEGGKAFLGGLKVAWLVAVGGLIIVSVAAQLLP